MNRVRLTPTMLIVLTLVASGGCAPVEKIPTYPAMPAQQMLETLHQRTSAIQTVSAPGSLRMTRRNGDSVILDVALALSPPKRARIRAWKFGQAIFDLTVNPDGVFLVAPPESSRREQIAAAGTSASAMIRSWLELLTGALDGAQVQQDDPKQIVVSQQRGDGTTLICTIDRPTITARSYKLLDDHGQQRFTMELSRYIEAGSQVWPTRIIAISNDGTMQLDMREVEINGEQAAEAFRPPARAEKLP
jgi:hypothetical protein